MTDTPTQPMIRPGNGYQFHCPTVNRTTRYMACLFIRHRVWRGESVPTPDCACAMRGSKCAAVEMMKMEGRGEATFYDAELTMHRVPAAALERIEKIILVPGHAAGLDLSPAQRQQLFGIGGMKISERLSSTETIAPVVAAPVTRRRKVTEAVQADDLTSGLAAIDSDKSAQINAALETITHE